MAELRSSQLWYPGQDFELSQEYPTLTEAGLVAAWRDYTEMPDIEPSPSVLGALAIPDQEPVAFASVDLCEVVRHTHVGMRRVEETVVSTINDIHAYCHGLSIGNNHDITAVAQVLMNAGLIEPVEEIAAIADQLRDWRQRGVYVFANTSTLEGCENGTIDFMARHMPGSFDGIAFPRNHDSTLPLTKGVVATAVIGRLSTAGSVMAVHIDDKPAHNTAFWTALSPSGHRIRTFQPYYPSSHATDPHSTVADTPLKTFIAAGEFLLDKAV